MLIAVADHAQDALILLAQAGVLHRPAACVPSTGTPEPFMRAPGATIVRLLGPLYWAALYARTLGWGISIPDDGGAELRRQLLARLTQRSVFVNCGVRFGQNR